MSSNPLSANTRRVRPIATVLVTAFGLVACSSSDTSSSATPALDGSADARDATPADAAPADAPWDALADGPVDASPADVLVGSDVASDSGAMGPVLEAIQCPAYDGTSCVLLFPRMAAPGQEVSSFTLYNSGDEPLIVTAKVEPAGAFTLVSPLPTVAPQDTAVVAVSFDPAAKGVFKAHLVFSSNAAFDAIGPSGLRIEAAVGTTACQAPTECLLFEDCPEGTCSACIGATEPPCLDGTVYGLAFGNGCKDPQCRCPQGAYYEVGKGSCASATACDATTPCAAPAVCDETLCMQFPHCEDRSDGSGFCK